MRRYVVVSFVVTSLVVLTAACGGSPTGPSGFNPKKPVTANNRPPSPPAGTLQTAKVESVQVFTLCEGENCSGEIMPDAEGVYKIPFNTPYFAKACLVHPQWGERQASISVGASMTVVRNSVIFYEKDMTSPVCRVSRADRPYIENDVISIEADENGWDIFDPYRYRHQFRVVELPPPYRR